MTPRPVKTALLFAVAALLATSLTGCGRRGPVELPAETQQRGAALRAQDQAQATRSRPAPGDDDEARPDPPIPGTIGNRPPEKYPFLLDPLLQ